MLRTEVDCIMSYLSVLGIVPLEIGVWRVVYVPRLIAILVRRVSMSNSSRLVRCGTVGWAKCSSVGMSFVPAYCSANLREMAENALTLGIAGRKQRRLALWPASLAIDAAIAIELQ